MREDEWVKAAMANDSVVVDMLIRLSSSELLTFPPAKKPVVLPSLGWAVRQPRTRPILKYTTVQMKKGESTRASPTTPLSWSGGTSSGTVAGAGDYFEESSFPANRPAGGVRSKVNATSETTIRRSRKKKTFAELKEEESLQLKENIRLKKELAIESSTIEELKAKNENLKRIKLDFQLKSEKETISDNSLDIKTASDDQTPAIFPISVKCDSFGVQNKDSTNQERSSIALPDLNLALEEDSSFEVLQGMS